MNIIILTKNDRVDETTYSIDDNRATHIIKILKSKVGDVLEIGLLNDSIGKSEVVDLNDGIVKLKILELSKYTTPQYCIDLILALPRPQTLKKVLATIATMGINNLYLIRSEKVEKSYFHSPLLEEKNYSKYLLEGLSQGKRVDLPKVTIHKKFKQFFENSFLQKNETSVKLLAHPDEDIFLNKKMLNNNNNIILAIGPEGGWNDFEINFMAEKGFQKFKLSKNILRVETAVTAALAQVELLDK
ncbi:MAG: RsmE family RNA methyltransferase [Melioribacteraceae bacterium]